MSRGKELIKNTGILMLAKISTQVVSFILLPLYTAILSTEEYGQVDVYTSLTMIIIPFITLQIEMAMFRYFIAEKDNANRIEIVSSSIAVVLVMTVMASILFWCINCIKPFPYCGYLYAYYLAMTLNTVLLQVCRAKGDNVGYGIATFISSAFAVCLNVVFIAGLRLGVVGILLSSIIAHIISSMYIMMRTNISIYLSVRSISSKRCKEMLNYSVPLIFNQVASWAVNYSDRLIILYYLGESFNGIYSVACKFSNITSTFFGVYNVAWTESVIRSLEDKDGEKYVAKVFEMTFILYTMLVTGILNLLPFFFGVLINEKFSTSYGHVPILLVSMMFSGMAATVGSIYIAFNRTKDVSITTMLAGVTNVVVHLILLKNYRLYAASVSTLVSFGVLFIYRILFVNRFFRLKFELKGIMLQFLILIFAWIAYIIRNPIMIVMGLLINLVSMGIVINRSKKMLLKTVKRSKKE